MPRSPEGSPTGGPGLSPEARLGFELGDGVMLGPKHFKGLYCPAYWPSAGHTSVASRISLNDSPDGTVKVTCLGCASAPMVEEVVSGDGWVIEIAAEDAIPPLHVTIRYDSPGRGSAVFHDVPVPPGFATVLPGLMLQPSPAPSEWPFKTFWSMDGYLEFSGYEPCDFPLDKSLVERPIDLEVSLTKEGYTTKVVIEMVNPYDFSIDIGLTLEAIDSDGNTLQRYSLKQLRDLGIGERGRLVYDYLHPRIVDVRTATKVETNIWPKSRQDTDVELLDQTPLYFPPYTQMILPVRNNTKEERFVITKHKYYDSDDALLISSMGGHGMLGPWETREYLAGTSGPWHAYVYLLDD